VSCVIILSVLTVHVTIYLLILLTYLIIFTDILRFSAIILIVPKKLAVFCWWWHSKILW